MEITEVRIKLMVDSDDRLQGFCSVTFDDCFVVRDLKIIDGTNGPFVAMPSRKLTGHCHQCGTKNHLKAPYCNQCGARQRDDRAVRDAEGRAKLYADIAHPINSQCREMIQNRVIAEFQTELDRAKQPGYVSRYDDDYDDDVDAETYITHDQRHAAPPPPISPSPVIHAQSGQVQSGQVQSGQVQSGQVQSGQAQPPAPHILPPVPAGGGTVSSGGPHFAGPPQREPVKETKDTPSQKQPPKGGFGAGVF